MNEEGNENNSRRKQTESPRRIDNLALDVSSWWQKTFVFVKKTEVATWKGALVLTFVAGVAISTVWGYSAGVFQESFAGTSTSLSLDPLVDEVQADEVFDLDAVINTDGDDVVAVKAMIDFDKNSFELQSIDTSNSTFSVGNTCQYDGKFCQIVTPVNEANASGQVTIVLANPSLPVNTQSGVVATLTFRALQVTSPGANNFTFVYSSGSYADSDMIARGSDGSDTLDSVVGSKVSVVPVPPPTCTDFTYSEFGTCQPDSTQTRTILTSAPEGCAGGSPVLSQACTFVAPTCESFTYNEYGACQPNNTRSRTVASSSPENCSGGDPVLIEACTYVAPICTSFTYQDSGECQPDNTQAQTVVSSSPENCTGGDPEPTRSCVYVAPAVACTDFTYSDFGSCQPNGTQIRTIATSSPEGCTGGSPVLSQSCTYVAPTCTSFTYNEYGTCQPNGTQTRTIVSSSPENCTEGDPVLTGNCTYVLPAPETCTAFIYSNWSACSADSLQARTITSSSPGGCTGGDSEELERECTLSEAEEGEVEVIDSDRTVKIEGEKQKFGKSDSFYSSDKKISFQGGNEDIRNGKVKIYSGGDLKEEDSVDGDGKWKTSVKVKNDGDYRFNVEYYNSAGEKVASSNKYAIKVDTEDPKFTDLPLALNKKRGDKIWWKAKDNRKIKEYKVEFLGKIKRGTRDSFNVPANAPKGPHILKVTAYDKAGNAATRRVTIWVR